MRGAGLNPARWPVRVRLTALYAGAFTLAGAVLVTVTYLLVSQSLVRPNAPGGGGDTDRLGRPLDLDAPQLDGTGVIKLESEDRAAGYFTTRSAADPALNARTVGIYWRAEPGELEILNGRDDAARADLISRKLAEWGSFRKVLVGADG